MSNMSIDQSHGRFIDGDKTNGGWGWTEASGPKTNPNCQKQMFASRQEDILPYDNVREVTIIIRQKVKG